VVLSDPGAQRDHYLSENVITSRHRKKRERRERELRRRQITSDVFTNAAVSQEWAENESERAGALKGDQRTSSLHQLELYSEQGKAGWKGVELAFDSQDKPGRKEGRRIERAQKRCREKEGGVWNRGEGGRHRQREVRDDKRQEDASSSRPRRAPTPTRPKTLLPLRCWTSASSLARAKEKHHDLPKGSKSGSSAAPSSSSALSLPVLMPLFTKPNLADVRETHRDPLQATKRVNEPSFLSALLQSQPCYRLLEHAFQKLQVMRYSKIAKRPRYELIAEEQEGRSSRTS
jgi:hypothetical protein